MSREVYASAVPVGDVIAFVAFLTSVLTLSCFVSTFIVTIKLNVALNETSPVKTVTDCPLAETVTVACAGELVLRLTIVPAASCA